MSSLLFLFVLSSSSVWTYFLTIEMGFYARGKDGNDRFRTYW